MDTTVKAPAVSGDQREYLFEQSIIDSSGRHRSLY